MSIRLVHLLLLAALLAAPALAGRPAPFRDGRVVSRSGRHYVVVRKVGPAMRFELCLRKEGEPPIGAEGAERDPGDELLAEGRVDPIPRETLVLDREAAVLLLGTRRSDFEGSVVLRLLDRSGEIRWRKVLADLFPDALEVYGLTRRQGIPWRRGHWVDEAGKRVVLVARDDRLREVDLSTGAVSRPGPEVLFTRFDAGPVEDRKFALEVASRVRPPGLAARARPIAERETESMAIRIRAAVCALRGGDAAPFRTLFPEAWREGQPDDVRGPAAAHLPELIGAEAIPVLRAAYQTRGLRAAAGDGFANLARRDLDSVVAIAADPDEDRYFRATAVLGLGASGEAGALPHLLRLVGGKPSGLASTALHACRELGGSGLAEGLADLLEKGTLIDFDLILELTRLKHREGVPAILDAWERMDRKDHRFVYVRNHLKALTDRDFGTDPSAWRKGLAGK